MATYIWSGIDRDGKKISGIDQAVNHAQLKIKLTKQNIFPLKITLKFTFVFLTHQKIKTKHITNLIEQLTVLINANIPIVKALTIISQDEQNPRIKDLVINCKNSISEGKSFYQTLQQYPQYFTELICSLINVGEQSGTLDIMLQELTSYLEKTALQKRKIIKALIYPASILCVTFVVTLILLIFVIPQFEIMFSNFGAKLPSYTQFIINFSGFLQATWKFFLAIIIGSVICIKIMHNRSIKFRQFIDKLSLNIPLVKTILIYAIISRLTKTLGLTLKSGVPLLTAINISGATIPNWQYKLAIQNTIELIANGKTLNSALCEQNLFPNKVIQLIALGEETGTLDLMLEKISIIYSEELNSLTDNLNNLLEPMIMLILGVIVGGLVIGMYLPIFRLGAII
ncbi:MAG: hypothetical protein ACD_58C00049G0003 [uncultured bacterium]|nr:MAG: hypothetical protein ACD_58C00049G0003 [uncultured bacterium]OGT08715.1 MAG: hypothetical protein A2V89_02145 [Gammaproteobacteria bacterium RBG_16_37_9]HBC71229.1 type II secretion system protein F [Coxiellaceae bacterium]HBS52339.1 type II secretion system protein F [Coxiellaceae bacterium]HBY55407.1 type II secretion system protein F [Coxiellaceae bacterium]